MAREPGPHVLFIACIVFAGAGAAIAASRVLETTLLGPADRRALAVRQRVRWARLLVGAIIVASTIAIPWASLIAERRAAIALLRDVEAGSRRSEAFRILARDASPSACGALAGVALDPAEELSGRVMAIGSTWPCADAKAMARLGVQDRVPGVRAAWAVGLNVRRRPDEQDLLDRLRRDPDPRVRFAADRGIWCFHGWDPRCPATEPTMPGTEPRR
jgi:hypothetical protein